MIVVLRHPRNAPKPLPAARSRGWRRPPGIKRTVTRRNAATSENRSPLGVFNGWGQTRLIRDSSAAWRSIESDPIEPIELTRPRSHGPGDRNWCSIRSMRLIDRSLRLSATDLANHLGCAHLTQLNRAAVERRARKPKWQEPVVAILQQRGDQHEAACLAPVPGAGHDSRRIRP